MNDSFQEGSPIFHQVEKRISDSIVKKHLQAGDQVPSTNQFATYYQINPATAAKGMNRLAEKGILLKKRGIGMFVAENARDKLMEDRRRRFYTDYVVTILEEASQLEVSKEDLKKMIDEGGSE